MVSEYKGSATQRLSTVMSIIVVTVLVLAVVRKYAIRCDIEDFAVKPSIKKKFYIKCHKKIKKMVSWYFTCFETNNTITGQPQFRQAPR
jgi:hypothetical protein